jgi:hypothetical protein
MHVPRLLRPNNERFTGVSSLQDTDCHGAATVEDIQDVILYLALMICGFLLH